MGVFHMAVPFPGASQEREPRVGREALGSRATNGTERRHKPGRPPGTLLPSTRSPEARLQRTPDQQAEQDALALLVQECMAGSQSAWHRMVSGQHKRVYGICYRFTGDASSSEDITQDVFLRIYRNLGSFDQTKGSFQTWVTTLTRNMLVDNYRRTKLDRATESMDESGSGDEDGPTRSERLADTRPNQEQRFAGLELKARIQAALAKVSPDLREAVILRDLEDMDYKEIAMILKIPEGTVKSRISRGRGELARLLGRIEGQVV